ncbi:family 2 glycosyl transferase [Paenibacillus polymyxa]|uniref:methyltransferase domain-containing protein n=1 Tax=Paenibacillus polymyxa TaxID=1406 RepID=UPI000D9E34DE|nr:methyltransferase domain-containing protein [Paenibacillus polymyxa]SPY14287.1 family 2 glycosyl transferase [Paenibacillus polymyxa]
MTLAEQKELINTLFELDNGLITENNVAKLLSGIQKNDVLEKVLNTISNEITNKIDVLNYIAVEGFNNGMYDHIIPSLQTSLEIDPFHKETLFNLSSILSHFGEIDIALDYAKKIQDNSDETLALMKELTNAIVVEKKSGSQNILNMEQNDISFTGERLVINQDVKDNFKNVLEEHLRRYELACEYSKDKIILDAACGTGYGSKMMQSAGAAMVIGVDIDQDSVNNAKKNYHGDNINFLHGNVNKLPFKEETFDMVVSFETIEHIANGSDWIKESARLLKEDGLFLVSTPNRSITNPGNYFEEQPMNQHHCFEYNITEFIGELLDEYDILDIFGQSYMNDHDSYYYHVMRDALQLNRGFAPDKVVKQTDKHELISLKDVKNAQPMYVVAVCRRKRKTPKRSSEYTKNSNPELLKTPTFHGIGENVFVGEGCEIVGAEKISIGNNVMIRKDCWLNIAVNQNKKDPQIIIDDGCQIGKNFTISVSNRAHLERNVLIGANVYISDCGHAYENIDIPIMHQGVSSETNEVTIGEGSWLGINSVIVGNVRVGKGSVVAANSFINKDVPDYSVVAGNPGRIIKMFDSVSKSWRKVYNDEDIEFILKNRVDSSELSL